MTFNVYLSKIKIHCGVDGDNNDNTCQASTQTDVQYKLRFDHFIIVVLIINVVSSIGILLLERRRVRAKGSNNELVLRQLNDWFELPGTISTFVLICIVSGLTEIYQLCFVTGLLILNGFLETIFVSYRISSVDKNGLNRNRNILVKYLSSLNMIVILSVATVSFSFLLANSNDFTVLWGVPIAITGVYIFISEFSKYFFYTKAIKNDYTFIRETVKQNQPLSSINQTETQIKQLAPADILTFFSLLNGAERRKVNQTILIHQLLQRIINLGWKLIIFFFIWYGTNNYEINFI